MALKHTPAGYFRHFYTAMGNRLLFNLLLAVTVGLMDGLGLALFIPLLQFVSDTSAPVDPEVMGGMSFIVEAFAQLGISLNLFSVLSLMVVVFCCKGLLNYWLTMDQVDLKQKYMVQLRLNQIADLQELSYKGFTKLDAGRIQNAVTAEIGRNLQAMIRFLDTTKAVVILFSYLVLAFVANWQFALFILAGGYVSNFLYKRLTNSVKVSSIEISKRGNLFSSYVVQAVFFFKYLKATNYFPAFAQKLKDVVGEVEGLNRKIGKNQAITLSSREPVIIFIVAVVILIQVNLLGGSLGPILLSLLLFYRALNGLVLVQNSWQNFMQNVGGVELVAQLKTEMQTEKEVQEGERYEGFHHQLELRKASFYFGNKPVLREIDLIIPKNKSIALVGESGAGKSTLANVFSSLLKLQQGEFLVDGEKVYQYDLRDFRSRIGYISQDPIIFSDNLFNNVTFWADPTPENKERFWEIIKKVSLADFVEALENKEETQLGDNGMAVSGGQKQRISIARELYKEVDLLILDEATSALDSETEKYVQRSLDELKGQYTMISIAHRLSTIKNADYIYLLENGRVTGSGSYEELLATSGRFRKMVSLQHV